MDQIETCGDCPVKHQSFCGGLCEQDLARLNQAGRRHKLHRGDTLCWAGEDSSLCANVLDGVLKVVAVTPDGREQTVGLHHRADFVGNPYGEVSEYTVTAVTDTNVCIFPRSSFERMLGESKDLETQILKRTLTALSEARTRILTLMNRSAEAKVAGFILELADRAGATAAQATPDGPVTFDLPLTRSEMAEVLGLTIETVSRQVNGLKAEGILGLPGVRSVTIRDRAALRRRALG